MRSAQARVRACCCAGPAGGRWQAGGRWPRRRHAGAQVVDGRARTEEALDLAAVEVDAADAVDAHGLHHLRHVGGGDRHTGAFLPVLPRVAVVRDDGRDVGGGGATDRRGAQEQLHQVVVDGGARGLDDVHVGVAHVLEDLDADLPATRE